MILSPTIVLCWLRAIWLSLKLWTPVSGHRYHECEPALGQPKSVMVLKCKLCGHVSVGWTRVGSNT